MKGKAHRPGVYQCNACREQFTVTVGTVFERSKIPLNNWLLRHAPALLVKEGHVRHQLHRMLGVTYKTAWFMTHRIREAMKPTATLAPSAAKARSSKPTKPISAAREPAPLHTARAHRLSKRKHAWHKRSVVALVERGGQVRTFHVENATKADVRDVLVRNVDRKSTLYTDESRLYTETGKEFAAHETVKHSAGEYVRWEDGEAIHTNTVENVFSVFKRGMRGVYQHCGEAHLHRYLAEFDFRYNRRTALGFTDAERTDDALKGIGGKRLTYRRIGEAANELRQKARKLARMREAAKHKISACSLRQFTHLLDFFRLNS